MTELARQRADPLDDGHAGWEVNRGGVGIVTMTAVMIVRLAPPE